MGRRLGQHFLFDPSILDRIVAALEPAADDEVIEIGPGKGTLTARLAPHVARIIAIEKDVRLAERLRHSWQDPSDRVTVVTGDALELDWHALLTAQSGCKVIGNIPYAITSPLIDKALTPPLPDRIVFLVQREVAARLSAKPGTSEYGALTVGVQVVAHVERLFGVPAGAFQPPPAVHSAVVVLVPLAVPLVSPDRHPSFRAFIAQLFSQRRKQLVRSLRSVGGFERSQAEQILSSLGVDPTHRVEVVDLQTLVALFDAVESLTVSRGDA